PGCGSSPATVEVDDPATLTRGTGADFAAGFGDDAGCGTRAPLPVVAVFAPIAAFAFALPVVSGTPDGTAVVLPTSAVVVVEPTSAGPDDSFDLVLLPPPPHADAKIATARSAVVSGRRRLA